MTLQQTRDWLNAHANVTIKDTAGKQKLEILDLHYRLLQQSEHQKRLNRLHKLVDRANDYWR